MWEVSWEIILLLVGLAMIIKGGDLFVASSVRIAEFLQVPRIVIGTTLVSLATTSPELVVSVTAGIRGESEMGVGAAVGSCMCNMCLILGLMAVIQSIGVRPVELKIPLVAVFFFSFLLLGLTWDLKLARIAGGALLAMGIGYFIVDFFHHRRMSRPEDLAEARNIESDLIAGNRWLVSRQSTAIVFTIGAVMVAIGSRFLVDSAAGLAGRMGVPTIIIGLTIVAVGTSLPELVTAIKSARHNVSDLGVGNILGANVANLTLIVGGAASFQEVTMDRATQLINFSALLIGLTMVFLMLASHRRIFRFEGGILIAFYVLYLAAVTGSRFLGGASP